MANQPLKVAFFNDFTGGLNLHSQRQNLTFNETPDCADVDFGQRGGIVLRRGYLNATRDSNMGTTATSGYVVGSYSFGTDKLWGISSAGRLWTWDDSTATHVVTAVTTNTTTEFVHGESWGAKLYFANAYNGGTTLWMRTWNDAAFATLGNAVNNNFSAPTGGNAPLARLICSHGGHMFWADTVEGGTRFRSRLRFSHPLQPEDFAAADYFDIEPDDSSDQITALVAFRGQLIVFKKRAVYGLYGTDRDNFVVERLSASAGAWSQESVTVSEDAIYWWSPDGDVMAYDGRNIVHVGTKIAEHTRHNFTSGNDHRLLWAEQRLYVSFLHDDGDRHLYVFDPLIGKGAWTFYTLPVTSMVWWRRVNGVNSIMMRLLGKPGIQDYNKSEQTQDDDGGGTSVPIQGYYCTSWFSADDTALKKRWKRLNATANAGDDCTLLVDVYHDFDEATVRKTLTLPIQATGGLLWGGSTWGAGVWGGAPLVYAFDRLQSVGRGHAIRFKFYIVDHVSQWAIDSFALPFIEKAYR